MEIIARYSFMVFIVSIITGCASTPSLAPNVENIKIVAYSNAPSDCQLKGRVAISKVDIYGPSHLTVQNQQINMLKTQAAKLGANLINLTQHQTAYYAHPEYIISEAKVQRELGAHAMAGNAYYCTLKALRDLSLKRSAKISDVKAGDE